MSSHLGSNTVIVSNHVASFLSLAMHNVGVPLVLLCASNNIAALQGRPHAGLADLPPLLEFANGTQLKHFHTEWPARREELQRLLQMHVFGTFPAGPPPRIVNDPHNSQRFVTALAQRGFIVLAFDHVCFASRLLEGQPSEFYRRHPKWSLLDF